MPLRFDFIGIGFAGFFHRISSINPVVNDLSAVAIAVVIFVIPVVSVLMILSRALGNPGLDNLWDVLKTRWWGELICALLFWAIAAFYYWSIGRHGFSAPSGWLDLILYSMLGKWRTGLVLDFLGSFVHIRRHLESFSQDSLRQERRRVDTGIDEANGGRDSGAQSPEALAAFRDHS